MSESVHECYFHASLVYSECCLPHVCSSCFPHTVKMLFLLCAEDVSFMSHLSEQLALVPVTETLHNFKVQRAVPWIRVLCFSLQMVLIIVLNGADIVDDGLETLLAEWTFRFNLQDQCIKS